MSATEETSAASTATAPAPTPTSNGTAPGEGDGHFLVRVRGIPFTASEADLAAFFKDCTLRKAPPCPSGVYIVRYGDGRPTGEAYVFLETQADEAKALLLTRQYLGHRYVEIFKANLVEYEFATKKATHASPGPFAYAEGGAPPPQYAHTPKDFLVRLKGLPYSVTKKDIEDFFSGIPISPNGVTIVQDAVGHNTGEGFVEFPTAEKQHEAVARHRQHMGSRYIEVFQSSPEEFRALLDARMARRQPFRPKMYAHEFGRPYHDEYSPYARPYERPHRSGYGPPGPYGAFPTHGMYGRDAFFGEPPRGPRQSTTGLTIRMRGIPFRATKGDVERFFAPIFVADVRFKFDHMGRPSGEAFADFNSEADVREALTRNMKELDNRYVELFREDGFPPPGQYDNRPPMARAPVPPAAAAAAAMSAAAYPPYTHPMDGMGFYGVPQPAPAPYGGGGYYPGY